MPTKSSCPPRLSQPRQIGHIQLAFTTSTRPIARFELEFSAAKVEPIQNFKPGKPDETPVYTIRPDIVQTRVLGFDSVKKEIRLQNGQTASPALFDYDDTQPIPDKPLIKTSFVWDNNDSSSNYPILTLDCVSSNYPPNFSYCNPPKPVVKPNLTRLQFQMHVVINHTFPSQVSGYLSPLVAYHVAIAARDPLYYSSWKNVDSTIFNQNSLVNEYNRYFDCTPTPRSYYPFASLGPAVANSCDNYIDFSLRKTAAACYFYGCAKILNSLVLDTDHSFSFPSKQAQRLHNRFGSSLFADFSLDSLGLLSSKFNALESYKQLVTDVLQIQNVTVLFLRWLLMALILDPNSASVYNTVAKYISPDILEKLVQKTTAADGMIGRHYSTSSSVSKRSNSCSSTIYENSPVSDYTTSPFMTIPTSPIPYSCETDPQGYFLENIPDCSDLLANTSLGSEPFDLNDIFLSSDWSFYDALCLRIDEKINTLVHELEGISSISSKAFLSAVSLLEMRKGDISLIETQNETAGSYNKISDYAETTYTLFQDCSNTEAFQLFQELPQTFGNKQRWDQIQLLHAAKSLSPPKDLESSTSTIDFNVDWCQELRTKYPGISLAKVASLLDISIIDDPKLSLAGMATLADDCVTKFNKYKKVLLDNQLRDEIRWNEETYYLDGLVQKKWIVIV